MIGMILSVIVVVCCCAILFKMLMSSAGDDILKYGVATRSLERERIARHFDEMHGISFFGEDVAKAIRDMED